jgi:hypothetical protein
MSSIRAAHGQVGGTSSHSRAVFTPRGGHNTFERPRVDGNTRGGLVGVHRRKGHGVCRCTVLKKNDWGCSQIWQRWERKDDPR